jgi:hypothetical protein
MTDCAAILSRRESRWYDTLHPSDSVDEYQTAIDNFYSDFRGKEEK